MEQKTVFLSYRRALSKHLARSIFLDLKAHGWDVFLDVNTIDSGDFDRIILNQIAARAHFVLLISPGALARCANPDDWVLREIQEAVRLERNLVPVIEEDADFTHELSFLPDDVRAAVSRKNGLRLYHEYFDEAMDRLRTRFLKTPAYIRLTAPPSADHAEVQRRLAAAEADSAPAASPRPGSQTRPAEGPEMKAALERARRFSGWRNRDWQPFIATFPDLPIPDMPFCLVPAGAFRMGSDEFDDEKPAHDQPIERPFWIGQHPVTNDQWRRAAAAGAVAEPRGNSGLEWYHDPKMGDAPVVGVDWFMARDFAAWLGCRLPTEREWEYAARGVASWRYPWGDDWDPDKAVWGANSGGRPAAVTSKPQGASWVGALHLSGNVWEWTSSLYQPYPYREDDGREADTGSRTAVRRVLRGGSFDGTTGSLRAALRPRGNPDDDSGYGGGFRCARSLE